MMIEEYVLLVESDLDYAARLKEALDEGGIRLETTPSSLEARRMAESQSPIALLLDLDHPPENQSDSFVIFTQGPSPLPFSGSPRMSIKPASSG